MHRLLALTENMALDRVVPEGDAARHLKVLRPREGEEIELFDGRGLLRRYRYRGGALLADGPAASVPPPACRLTLFACVTKGSRWDWTVEKAVELGASRIVPVLSARCVVRLSAAERLAKAERWRRIAADAARQSDAAWLPEVLEPVDFAAALELARGVRTFVGALADPPPPPLLAALDARPPAPGVELGMFTGPEGDFSPDELAALMAAAEPVSFGPTVLRAETAAIFGLSVLAAAAHAARDGGGQRGART